MSLTKQDLADIKEVVDNSINVAINDSNFATKQDLDDRLKSFATKTDLTQALEHFEVKIVEQVNELFQPLIDSQDRMQATLDGVVKVASLGQLAEVTTKDHEIRITRLELQAGH